MDKKEFYLRLSEKLINLGVDKKYISRHIGQFDEYFSGKSDEEISSEILKLGNLDKVALKIKNMTDKIAAEENEQIRDNTNVSENENAETAPKPVEKESDISQDYIEETENFSNEEKAEIRSDNPDIISDPAQDDAIGIKSAVQNLTANTEQSDIVIDNDTLAQNKSIYSDEQNDEISNISNYVPDEETVKYSTKKFWIIFGVSAPLILVILLAVVAAFSTAFFLIALLIIFAVIALIGIVAGGTMISVLGLVFGIVKMLSVKPVGLYECGISIIIGGLTMMSGILIYNFAVRLMPFAAKYLLKFAKYVKNKFIELFVYVKKECIGS